LEAKNNFNGPGIIAPVIEWGIRMGVKTLKVNWKIKLTQIWMPFGNWSYELLAKNP